MGQIEKKYSEIDNVIINIRCIEKYINGFKILDVDNDDINNISKNMADNIKNTIISNDNAYIIDKPDLVVFRANKEIAFEHFDIANRISRNKNGKLDIEAYKFLNKNVLNKTIHNNKHYEFKISDDSSWDKNLSIIDSFIYSYDKHLKKVSSYLKNVQEGIQGNSTISNKDIWFIVNSVDCAIIDSNTHKEIPVIAIDNVLKHISEDDPIGGIVYVGFTGIFIIPMEAIKYLKDSKASYNCTIYTADNILITSKVDKDKASNNKIKIFFMQCDFFKNNMEDPYWITDIDASVNEFVLNKYGKVVHIRKLGDYKK